ncbi:MAG TPA: FHA domain-containing protein [Pyrinomonadaceae bacterium]|jgi:pSer/pThr/pTyr-binding forkhead associated (FHA) protein|nr:FHA domain-containing protein [Pyrinomonadaceae bacterium]
MPEIILLINSPEGSTEVPLNGEVVTIGRTDPSSVVIAADTGLSRRHASFHDGHGSVWVTDENSTNGSFVNGARVPPEGMKLSDGDQVSIGNYTMVTIRANPDALASASASPSVAPPPPTGHAATPLPATGGPSILLLIIPAVAIVIILSGAVAFIMYRRAGADERTESDDSVAALSKSSPDDSPDILEDTGAEVVEVSEEFATATPIQEVAIPVSPVPSVTPSSFSPLLSSSEVAAEADEAANVSAKTLPSPGHAALPAGERKLYLKMSEEEKKEYIKGRAQRIAIMMGKRPYAFTPEALHAIGYWLDAFAKRVGNNRMGLWGGDTKFILDRATRHAPVIIRAFNERGVPPVIGLYIPFIETEYTNITSDNFAGAAGLFQFLGSTAEYYGVPSAQRTDVEKMAPAAAKYFRDNIMSFGDDSMSVALAIAGYNRNPESVKRDLRNVLNAAGNQEKERSFWTLIVNKGKLDEYFQRENVNYVPRFFAAAILGENPRDFGIEMRKLSTYRQVETPVADTPPKISDR